MPIPNSTLEKMAAASNQTPRRRFWQFSLTALFALITFSCLAAYASRPLLPYLQEWFFDREQTVSTEPEELIPATSPAIDPCPGCGMG